MPSEPCLAGTGFSPPRLVSLRGVDVGNLVVVDIDLSWCLFAGAHRLDQLRFEGDCWSNSPPFPRPGTRRAMLLEDIMEDDRLRHPDFVGLVGVSRERAAGLY